MSERATLVGKSRVLAAVYGIWKLTGSRASAY